MIFGLILAYVVVMLLLWVGLDMPGGDTFGAFLAFLFKGLLYPIVAGLVAWGLWTIGSWIIPVLIFAGGAGFLSGWIVKKMGLADESAEEVQEAPEATVDTPIPSTVIRRGWY